MVDCSEVHRHCGGLQRGPRKGSFFIISPIIITTMTFIIVINIIIITIIIVKMLIQVCSNTTVGEEVCRTHYETSCETRYRDIYIEMNWRLLAFTSSTWNKLKSSPSPHILTLKVFLIVLLIDDQSYQDLCSGSRSTRWSRRSRCARWSPRGSAGTSKVSSKVE